MKKTKRQAARKAAGRRSKTAARGRRTAAKARPSAKRAAKSGAASGLSDLKRQYLAFFAREFPTTLKLMKAYPGGKDEFKPHDRSSSAARLAHTFSMENALAAKAVQGELHMPPEFPPAPATFVEAVANYERGARELLAAVENMPDARMAETVTFFTGPRQFGEIPVSEFLWMLLLDSIHHRGQLSVYIRMAGGKVPSIYGPSADEPWM